MSSSDDQSLDEAERELERLEREEKKKLDEALMRAQAELKRQQEFDRSLKYSGSFEYGRDGDHSLRERDLELSKIMGKPSSHNRIDETA